MGDIKGTVTDRGGRPLPFVVVTSRTANGFLSVWSDLQGEFAFPGRPHTTNSSISFASAGFERKSVRVGTGNTSMSVVLESAHSPLGRGWAIGLSGPVAVRVLRDDASPLDRLDGMMVDRTYTLELRTVGSGSCMRKGPAQIRVDSTFVRAGAAVFQRGGACTRDAREHVWRVPFVVTTAGEGEIQVVNRHETLSFRIRAQ